MNIKYNRNMGGIEIGENRSIFQPMHINKNSHTGRLSDDPAGNSLELIDADLYVSPSGDDNNDGLTEANPLKTIRKAFSKIRADDLHQNYIFLKEGTYSTSGNGEQYPLCLPDHMNIKALEGETVLLNAANSGGVIYLMQNQSNAISDIQITGGKNSNGAGIYADRSHGQNLA